MKDIQEEKEGRKVSCERQIKEKQQRETETKREKSNLTTQNIMKKAATQHIAA